MDVRDYYIYSLNYYTPMLLKTFGVVVLPKIEYYDKYCDVIVFPGPYADKILYEDSLAISGTCIEINLPINQTTERLIDLINPRVLRLLNIYFSILRSSELGIFVPPYYRHLVEVLNCSEHKDIYLTNINDIGKVFLKLKGSTEYEYIHIYIGIPIKINSKIVSATDIESYLIYSKGFFIIYAKSP